MTIPGMKQRIRDGETLAGYVAAIPSAVSVQAIAAAGADWIVLDQEHGAVGPESLHAMITATAGTPCAPLVRVPRCDEAWVKPALDLGAEGIVFPQIRTAADAAACVSLLRYPPQGRRGWGPFVAHARWGVGLFDYRRSAASRPSPAADRDPRRGGEHRGDLPGGGRRRHDHRAVRSLDRTRRLRPVRRARVPRRLRPSGAGDPRAGIPLGAAALTREQTRDLLGRGHRLPVHGFDVLMLGSLVRQTAEWRQRGA